MSEHGSRRSLYIIVVLVFVLIILFIVFNRGGLMALASMRKDIENLSVTTSSLQIEIDSLVTELDRLRLDSLFMEKVVRETLGWGREGEHIIKITPPDSALF